MAAMTDEQREQLREGAAAVVAGAPPPVIIIERRRLAEPRLVSPAEAEDLFRERVIDIG